MSITTSNPNSDGITSSSSSSGTGGSGDGITVGHAAPNSGPAGSEFMKRVEDFVVKMHTEAQDATYLGNSLDPIYAVAQQGLKALLNEAPQHSGQVGAFSAEATTYLPSSYWDALSSLLQASRNGSLDGRWAGELGARAVFAGSASATNGAVNAFLMAGRFNESLAGMLPKYQEQQALGSNPPAWKERYYKTMEWFTPGLLSGVPPEEGQASLSTSVGHAVDALARGGREAARLAGGAMAALKRGVQVLGQSLQAKVSRQPAAGDEQGNGKKISPELLDSVRFDRTPLQSNRSMFEATKAYFRVGDWPMGVAKDFDLSCNADCRDFVTELNRAVVGIGGSIQADQDSGWTRFGTADDAWNHLADRDGLERVIIRRHDGKDAVTLVRSGSDFERAWYRTDGQRERVSDLGWLEEVLDGNTSFQVFGRRGETDSDDDIRDSSRGNRPPNFANVGGFASNIASHLGNAFLGGARSVVEWAANMRSKPAAAVRVPHPYVPHSETFRESEQTSQPPPGHSADWLTFDSAEALRSHLNAHLELKTVYVGREGGNAPIALEYLHTFDGGAWCRVGMPEVDLNDLAWVDGAVGGTPETGLQMYCLSASMREEFDRLPVQPLVARKVFDDTDTPNLQRSTSLRPVILNSKPHESLRPSWELDLENHLDSLLNSVRHLGPPTAYAGDNLLEAAQYFYGAGTPEPDDVLSAFASSTERPQDTELVAGLGRALVRLDVLDEEAFGGLAWKTRTAAELAEELGQASTGDRALLKRTGGTDPTYLVIERDAQGRWSDADDIILDLPAFLRKMETDGKGYEVLVSRPESAHQAGEPVRQASSDHGDAVLSFGGIAQPVPKRVADVMDKHADLAFQEQAPAVFNELVTLGLLPSDYRDLTWEFVQGDALAARLDALTGRHAWVTPPKGETHHALFRNPQDKLWVRCEEPDAVPGAVSDILESIGAEDQGAWLLAPRPSAG